MDRKKIKEEAKNKIKNNLWNIWKPYLVISIITSIITFIFVYFFNIEVNSLESNIVDAVVSLISLPLTIGYLNGLLNFIRGKEIKIKDIFGKMNIVIPILIVNIIVSIAVIFGTALFIIPGIIVSLMFAMTSYLLADGESNIKEILKKSVNMIKGYKGDFLLFGLSFFGWILLGIITFGIAFIYVIPYMNVSMALYYEELNKIKKA